VNEAVRYLARADVVAACRDVDTVAAVREALRAHGTGRAILPAEACLRWVAPSGAPARSLSMPGYVGGKINHPGAKIINANATNPDRGIPRASGVTLIFDSETARVVCIMDATYISAMRTASVTVLAAELLGGRPLRRAAVLGAGELGAAHVELLKERLGDLETIDVFDIVHERAVALCSDRARSATDRMVRLRPADSARDAIETAQLVVTTTTTTEGYIRHQWLRPGALVVNVSLDDVCAEAVLAVDHLIVDDWQLIRQDDRRLLGRLYRENRLVGPGEVPASGARAVDASLGDVVCGRYNRPRSPDHTVIVNPFGMAIEDILIADRVYDVARRRRIGVELPL
jgi:ornithine cyclodeaminase